MIFKSSLGEEVMASGPFSPNMEQPRLEDSLANILKQTAAAPKTTSDIPDPLITTPPELRLRNAVAEPQNVPADCQQIAQQASQSVQQALQSASQASQQASQSIQQASQQAGQQASQAAQQASQSASIAIQNAQQSAEQSISAASRTASQALASASSVVASVQSSASQAIASAEDMASQAQASASMAQSRASSAVLQAGAAVAAATGSAAAAGSSFLAAAAEATRSADASVSAIGAQASSQVQQASIQITASQVQAVTATQAALAIVGSVIASALITILIYFLIIRHKKKRGEKSGRSRARSNAQRDMPSPRTGFTEDSKLPSDLDESTVVATPSQQNAKDSDNSLSLFPKSTTSDPPIKTTSVKWNPSKPPKVPRLQSWLNVQEVSPFGPIQLPTDEKSSKGPMGGQLKSPMRNYEMPKDPVKGLMKSPSKSPSKSTFRLAKERPTMATETAKAVQVMAAKKPVQIVQRSGSKESRSASPKEMQPGPVVLVPETTVEKVAQKAPETASGSTPEEEYRDLVRASKASLWTDDIPYESPAAPRSPPAAPLGLVSVDQTNPMQLPVVQGPIRNTAEWFAAQSKESVVSQEPKTPQYPRPNGRMGLPSKPGPNRGYSVSVNDKRVSNKSTASADVGKAL